MATKARPKKKPKANKKPKLRGGNSDKPADEPLIASTQQEQNGDIIPLETLLEAESEADEAAADNATEGTAKTAENIPNSIPDVPSLDPTKAFDSPESLAEYDHDTAAEAETRRRSIIELREKLDGAKDAYSSAKAALKEANTQLIEWLGERNSGRGKPPKPKMADLYAKAEGGTAVATPPLPLAPSADDESWKSIPLSELADKDDFPDYLVAKLATAQRKNGDPQPPITTLGELVKFQEPEASGWTKKLTDLQGIGEGAMDKISEATGRFWERWAKEQAARMAAAKETESQPGGGTVFADAIPDDEAEDEELEDFDDEDDEDEE